MKIANIKYNSVGNWYGISTSVYVSGCEHRCKGCFNPETWNKEYGYEYTKEVEDKIIESLKPKHIKSLVLLGGEPFMHYNIDGLVNLCIRAKDEIPDINIVAFTGYSFEKLYINKDKYKLLNLCDYLVDGKFIQELSSPNLKFRGSSNQRIIDVQQSFVTKGVVLY